MGIKLLCLCLAACSASWLLQDSQVAAQDILRRTQQQSQQHSPQPNPLDDIQLPPQLASLTPQQLHQLAQLRELQIQQEAAKQQEAAMAAQQQRQSRSQNPHQAGLEAAVLPTAQPAPAQSSGQIPQPGQASTGTTPANNERQDDGSYNESGSEMEGVAMSSSSQPSGSDKQASGDSASANSVAASAPTFEVNWNKCPQLEPSESEKNKKTQVITKCLQSAPIPTNLTRENVEAHREQIATCALKVEGWFDDQGQYKYDKAETEIRGKKLDPVIENQVLKFHVACQEEASKKFPRDQNKLIDQVQFYQACMDYYISIVCEIEVSVDQ